MAERVAVSSVVNTLFKTEIKREQVATLHAPPLPNPTQPHPTPSHAKGGARAHAPPPGRASFEGSRACRAGLHPPSPLPKTAAIDRAAAGLFFRRLYPAARQARLRRADRCGA